MDYEKINMKKLMLLIVVFSVFNFTNSSAQEKIVQKEDSYEFLARTMLPMSMSPKDISADGYSVKFSKEEIVSELPYFGTVRKNTNLGRDKGMRFRGKPEQYEVLKNEKETVVEAIVKTENDRFVLTLTISPSNYAMLNIQSRNREIIVYQGEIR